LTIALKLLTAERKRGKKADKPQGRGEETRASALRFGKRKGMKRKDFERSETAKRHRKRRRKDPSALFKTEEKTTNSKRGEKKEGRRRKKESLKIWEQGREERKTRSGTSVESA